MGPVETPRRDIASRSAVAGRNPKLGILMVASEVAPWAKTGGLADVTGALPAALERLGHDITTVFPRYRGVTLGDGVVMSRRVMLGDRPYAVDFHVSSPSPRRRFVAVDVPELFDRDGFYGAGGRDFPDNGRRFGLLNVAALDFAEHDPERRPIDIVHAHDWQAGLAPVFLRAAPARYPRLRRAATVFTIHNLAYQGLFPRDVVPDLGLPWTVFGIDAGEFWGQFSFLKAGIVYSDYVTTVSPTYAEETLTAEWGSGLDGVLSGRASRYVGILNGIDTDVWNPETDPFLPAHYSQDDLTGKTQCKRALLERVGLSFGDDALARPVVGMVSRLVDQKGLDLIQQASADLVGLDATWIFVGTGDAKYEGFLRRLATAYPSRVRAEIGFDESLAHLVEAGSDIFLMPSKFEPCGLNQMYSLRYGTVPVVNAVGGLDDTIQPYTARAIKANGFKFRIWSPHVLVKTVRQAVRLYHNKAAWLPLMKAGMTADHSWRTSAREYVKVYRWARHAAAFVRTA